MYFKEAHQDSVLKGFTEDGKAEIRKLREEAELR